MFCASWYLALLWFGGLREYVQLFCGVHQEGFIADPQTRKWRPQSCCQMPFRAKPVWLSGFWFRKCCCSGWSDSLFERLILCFEDVDISSAASMNWRKISQKGNLDQQHFCVSPPPPTQWINLNRMILRCNFLLSKSLLKKIRKY